MSIEKRITTTKMQNLQANTALVVKYGKGKKQFAAVEDLKQASSIVTNYIDSKDLGASGWYGSDTGNVYDISGAIVAKISYNGRIWDPAGKEIK